MAKFTPGVTGLIRGSIGSTTFSKNRFGWYMKIKAAPVNPSSSRQQAIRNIFSQLTELWTSTLTQAQRDAWSLWASQVELLDRDGNPYFMTGFNAYIRSNTVALDAGVTRIDDGPTIFTMAPTDSTLAATASEATQLLSIAFDTGLDWVDQNDGVLQILMSRPQGAGTEFIKGPFQLAGIVQGDAVTPPTSPQTFTVPFAVAEGQKLEVQARILEEDGRLSQPFRDKATVAA